MRSSLLAALLPAFIVSNASPIDKRGSGPVPATVLHLRSEPLPEKSAVPFPNNGTGISRDISNSTVTLDATIQPEDEGIVTAQASSPWFPDMDPGRDSRWMASLPDSMSVHALSIPGTHDTMTDKVHPITGFGYVKTQNYGLEDQYKSGIRFVDIRIHHEDNHFTIHHAAWWLGYYFPDVLKTTAAYLESHPTEFVIMRMSDEPGGGHDGNTKTFEEQMLAFMTDDPETAPIFAKYHYLFNSPDRPWPTLGQVRGKFIMLYDFKNENHQNWGLPWAGSWGGESWISLDDNWQAPGMDSKWETVNRNLALARNTNPSTDKRAFITFLSGSNWLYNPSIFAQGTLILKGMNPRMYSDLDDARGDTWRTGIVVMDFPGQGLIDRIIWLNNPVLPIPGS